MPPVVMLAAGAGDGSAEQLEPYAEQMVSLRRLGVFRNELDAVLRRSRADESVVDGPPAQPLFCKLREQLCSSPRAREPGAGEGAPQDRADDRGRRRCAWTTSPPSSGAAALFAIKTGSGWSSSSPALPPSAGRPSWS